MISSKTPSFLFKSPFLANKYTTKADSAMKTPVDIGKIGALGVMGCMSARFHNSG